MLIQQAGHRDGPGPGYRLGYAVLMVLTLLTTVVASVAMVFSEMERPRAVKEVVRLI